MTTTEKQARKSLREKGIKAFWYFKSEAVSYGVAMIHGQVCQLTISNARRELRCTKGFPVHFSPADKLAKGIKAAKKYLATA